MPYMVQQTSLDGVLILQPKVFSDPRGFFYESFNAREFEKSTGVKCNFVQDNHSKSVRGVLRGLHYQLQHPQGKLVRVTQGEVLDVAVDIRRSSPTFGKWAAVRLSSDNQLQFWIPEGFAHGFYVLSETAEFLYKTTDYYHPQSEQCILWNDRDIQIDWGIVGEPLLSGKDAVGHALIAAETFA
jgi:dTDP-4-dehydrorhamnose 3,5-epimerase